MPPLSRLLAWLARASADPGDSEELRLQKMLLVAAVLSGFGVILGWGIFDYVCGEWTALGLDVLEGLLMAWSVARYLQRRHSFQTFYRWQAGLIFVLTDAIMFSLGGIVPSGVMILWPMLAPMTALFASTSREALRWFCAYVVLVIVAVALAPVFAARPPLPPTAYAVILAMNLIVPMGFIFLVLLYCVKGNERLFRLSEDLLLNILPRDIAARLKAAPRTIADHFPCASIMFADVVDFTPLSARMSPADLVEMLNEAFSLFDELAQRHGVEKIKTIGDCYMAAAGVPVPCPDHAQRLVRMALDIHALAATRRFGGQQLRFRIGIHSGPVTAGVIGRSKFIYDVWGDAVNTASRMESHGSAGTIQITEATHALLDGAFMCAARGEIHVKGKGPLAVWHVLGPVPADRHESMDAATNSAQSVSSAAPA